MLWRRTRWLNGCFTIGFTTFQMFSLKINRLVSTESTVKQNIPPVSALKKEQQKCTLSDPLQNQYIECGRYGREYIDAYIIYFSGTGIYRYKIAPSKPFSCHFYHIATRKDKYLRIWN